MDENFSLSAAKLKAYLRRIDYNGELSPTRPVLEALHLAHVTHIPFENIDVILGRLVRVHIESVHKKLVQDKRGGYCFEQNTLFAAALLKLGFNIDMLAARVCFRTNRETARTHMVLLVQIDGDTWLADVGFGAYGLLLPVLLGPGKTIRRFSRAFRIKKEKGLWLLRSMDCGAGEDLYAFSLEPQKWVDYEVANHYVSTHPNSIFTRTLTVQMQTEDSQVILEDNELLERKGGEETRSVILEEDQLPEILREKFNLRLDPDTLFSLQKTFFK